MVDRDADLGMASMEGLAFLDTEAHLMSTLVYVLYPHVCCATVAFPASTSQVLGHGGGGEGLWRSGTESEGYVAIPHPSVLW